jgi:alpha-L-fucosidase 2
LLEACIAGGQNVGEAEEFLEKLEDVLSQLPSFQIGSHGQLQEWFFDYAEPDLHHRHTAHLLSLFPFGQICPDRTPDLAAAAQVSIDRRTTPEEAWEDTGWARSLLILYAARLCDGEAAARHIHAMQRTLTDTNLMVFHPAVAGAPSDVYELDGNTGLTSGIAEMLLQSHDGVLHLLPALPLTWRSGSVTGLCARGGFVVNIAWQDSELVEATILSKTGVECQLRYRDSLIRFEIPANETYNFDPGSDHLIEH